ncbi:hypothetical protein D0C27_11010 [Alcaligenes faecalis]|uniref:hypothetical protein n=1 Tax=Alcaligenes faecalis TaxID=511 RepID=UPI0010CA3C86|nr:hypothetical protein [Alcaligenes faecalis]QCP82380.1 hypothetical protein D0C27_11010 [Alcaligenes faecalis]
MSDIMLNAVIHMPYEMAMKDELSRRQFYERANQALNERNAKSAEVEQLEEALYLALEYWTHRQQRYRNRTPTWVQKARAALSGEPT